MTTVEVSTSVERRRRWSRAQKQRLVGASLERGASVSSTAREAGIHPSQLYGWRRRLHARQAIGFAAVQIPPAVSPGGLAAPGDMAIEFASGARIWVTGALDPAPPTPSAPPLPTARPPSSL